MKEERLSLGFEIRLRKMIYIGYNWVWVIGYRVLEIGYGLDNG